MTAPTPREPDRDAALLQRHLDGTLSDGERRALEARLAREPELAAELARARAWNDHLAGVLRGALAPPTDLDARVRAWCAAPAGDVGVAPPNLGANRRGATNGLGATTEPRPTGGPGSTDAVERGRVLPFRRDSLLAAAAGVLLAVSLGLGSGWGEGRQTGTGPAGDDLPVAWLDGAYEAYAASPTGSPLATMLDCNLLEDPVAPAAPGSWSALHLAGPLAAPNRASTAGPPADPSPDPRPPDAPAPDAPTFDPVGMGGGAGGPIGFCGCLAPHPSGETVHHLADFPADLRLPVGWSFEPAGRSPELPGALVLRVHGPAAPNATPHLVIALPDGAPRPGLRDRTDLRLARRPLAGWTLLELAPHGAPDLLPRFLERP